MKFATGDLGFSAHCDFNVIPFPYVSEIYVKSWTGGERDFLPVGVGLPPPPRFFGLPISSNVFVLFSFSGAAVALVLETEGGTGMQVGLRGPVGIGLVGWYWFKLWFCRDLGPLGIRPVRGPIGTWAVLGPVGMGMETAESLRGCSSGAEGDNGRLKDVADGL